jgi:hypothetical protein
MKKHTLTLALILAAGVSAMAQTKDTTVTIKLPLSKLTELQQILQFSYQWLPKSKAPAEDVFEVNNAIQDVFKVLVVDKPKEVMKPVEKKK